MRDLRTARILAPPPPETASLTISTSCSASIFLRISIDLASEPDVHQFGTSILALYSPSVLSLLAALAAGITATATTATTMLTHSIQCVVAFHRIPCTPLLRWDQTGTKLMF